MKKTLLATAVASAAILAGISQPAVSHEAGDWIFRIGATNVDPDASSSLISTADTGPLPGTGADVGDSTQLGLNLVYMLSDNIGVEVLAATPFEHDLEAEGLGAYNFDVTDLGSTKHLPPTVTANYFFGTADSTIRPYLGVGVNYTTFFSEDLSGSARSGLGARSLELDDSWGIAWRGGVDWEINESWLINASFWKIDLETDATFSSALGRVKANVDVDPWVYMISLGFKF
ncbi:MAG: outer membrane beta-barrel protein [Gammaproteobacteria bacterium]|nr:outer membrane beta-barrel protein [Gammaproteobacteria bacterium]